jgi:hypothetical protein
MTAIPNPDHVSSLQGVRHFFKGKGFTQIFFDDGSGIIA